MSRSVKIIVSGKVQGVCFRANTKKQAEIRYARLGEKFAQWRSGD